VAALLSGDRSAASPADESASKADPIKARLAYIWTKRTVAEIEATARFAAYAERMRRLGVPPRFVEEAGKASEDERRHTRICREMAGRFGVSGIDAQPDDYRVHEGDSPERLFGDVIATCCFSETLNVALLSSTLKFARDPGIREATRELLGDEVRHSRLGWAYLTWGRLQGLGSSIPGRLPEMLVTVSGPKLFRDAPRRADEEGYRALGDAHMSERRVLFETTLAGVILQGLEDQGIATDSARNWLRNPSWPEGHGED